jgi:RND family efflux transporter MFP subunit
MMRNSRRILCEAAIVAAFLLLPGSAMAEEFMVESRPVADLKAVFGTVESVDQTLSRSRIAGTVTELAVDEGSRIELGQHLAVVADPKLPLQLTALDARIRSLESQHALAQLEYDRIAQLHQSGTASQARLDEARTNLSVVIGDLAAQRAERAVVAEQLAEGAVLAPASGRVLRVDVVDGQVVMAGETVAVIATDHYVLRLRLPERHARFIEVGDLVQVGSRGLETAPERLAEGRIRQVYPEMEDGRVVADVEATGIGGFFIGERARVYVATGERQAVVVPAEYLYKRFGLDYALVKGIGETVVQTGLPVDGGIEVLAGLEPGDVLLPGAGSMAETAR